MATVVVDDDVVVDAELSTCERHKLILNVLSFKYKCRYFVHLHFSYYWNKFISVGNVFLQSVFVV